MSDNRGMSAPNLYSWWTLEKYDTGSSAWTTENSIPSPGIDEMTEDNIGTAQMLVMVDGSLGRINADTRWNFDKIRFLFHKSTTTTNMISQLREYLTDNTGIRLTTHTGDKFEGYIEIIRKLWNFRPGESQEYTLEVVFQQFDVDGDGIIG